MDDEPLLDLEDVYRPFEDPKLRSSLEAETATAEAQRHAVAPWEQEEFDPNKVVNLSETKPAPPPEPEPRAAAAPSQSQAPQPTAHPMQRIPANATAFGSDDLFGPARPQEESAMDAVYNFPGKVRQHVLADCMGVVPSEPEVRIDPAEAGVPVPSQEESVTINRAIEGRWVPTYMRQQLVAGGHTSLPSAPNGHEYAATAQPPSLGQAFADVGSDLGESAQYFMEFMAAFFTSLSFQCQACGQQTVSTAHEQVMTCGDWCVGAEDDPEGPVVIPVTDQVALGGQNVIPPVAQNVHA